MPTGAGSSHAVNRAGGTIRDPLIVQERAPKPSATRIEAGLAPDGAKREVVGRRPMKSVARNTVRVSRLPHGHSRYRLGVIRESRIEGFFGDGLRSTTYHTRHQLLAAPSFPLAAGVACAVREARKCGSRNPFSAYGPREEFWIAGCSSDPPQELRKAQHRSSSRCMMSDVRSTERRAR